MTAPRDPAKCPVPDNVPEPEAEPANETKKERRRRRTVAVLTAIAQIFTGIVKLIKK